MHPGTGSVRIGTPQVSARYAIRTAPVRPVRQPVPPARVPAPYGPLTCDNPTRPGPYRLHKPTQSETPRGALSIMEKTTHAPTETVHSYAEAAVVHHPVPLRNHPAATGPLLAPGAIPQVVEVRTLDGRVLLQYADLSTLTDDEPAAPAPTSNAVPAWAKTTALLLVSASASMVMAAYAAKVFAEAATAIVAALILLAKVAVVLAFLVALVPAVIKRRTGGTQIATATATARAGFLGRAKATATATISNR